MNAFTRQTMHVLHTWRFLSLFGLKEKGYIHATQLQEVIFCILCFIQFINMQCAIIFHWELRMNTERKPTKVWSMCLPTSFSQYT